MQGKLNMLKFQDLWVNIPSVHPDGIVFVFVSMHVPKSDVILILGTLNLVRLGFNTFVTLAI